MTTTKRYTDEQIEAMIQLWDSEPNLYGHMQGAAAMLKQLLAERDAALAEVKAHEDAAEDRAIARDLARMPRNVR